MNKKILYILLFGLFITSVFAGIFILDLDSQDISPTVVSEERIERVNQDTKIDRIQDLSNTISPLNLYTTEGYVVKIYDCACPADPDITCKPCMRDNIVISEENILINNYNDLTENDMLVFLPNGEALELGKKYKFVIEMTDKKTTSESYNDIELVSYSE